MIYYNTQKHNKKKVKKNINIKLVFQKQETELQEGDKIELKIKKTKKRNENYNINSYTQIVKTLTKIKSQDSSRRKKKNLRGSLKYNLRKIYKELNSTDKIEASKIYCEYLKIEPLKNNMNCIFSDEAESEILVKNGNIDWQENIELSLDITGCHINNNIFNENFNSNFVFLKKEIEEEKVLLSTKQNETENKEKEQIKNIDYMKLSKDLETYIERENVKNKKIISKNKKYKNYKNDPDFENFKKIRDKRNLEKKLAKSLQIKEKKEKKEKEEIEERRIQKDKKEKENRDKIKIEKEKQLDKINESKSKSSQQTCSLSTRLKKSVEIKDKIVKILDNEKREHTLENFFEVGYRFGKTICNCNNKKWKMHKLKKRNSSKDYMKRHIEGHVVYSFIMYNENNETSHIMLENQPFWQSEPTRVLKPVYREHYISHVERGDISIYVSLSAKIEEELFMFKDYGDSF